MFMPPAAAEWRMLMKRILTLMMILAALVCLCACGSKDDGGSASSQNPPAASSQGSSSETGSADNSAQTDSLFTPGTWLSDGVADGQLYFFDPDGASGRTAGLESGMGAAFTYTCADGEAEFRMGSEDTVLRCQVLSLGDGCLTLQWDDGSEEKLTYLSEEGSDTFRFYSNDELCRLAVAHCAAENGISADELEAGAQTNDDGTVSIQVYQNLGDHNSTAAWYTVDRFTAQGSNDTTGESVSLAD